MSRRGQMPVWAKFGSRKYPADLLMFGLTGRFYKLNELLNFKIHCPALHYLKSRADIKHCEKCRYRHNHFETENIQPIGCDRNRVVDRTDRTHEIRDNTSGFTAKRNTP